MEARPQQGVEWSCSCPEGPKPQDTRLQTSLGSALGTCLLAPTGFWNPKGFQLLQLTEGETP